MKWGRKQIYKEKQKRIFDYISFIITSSPRSENLKMIGNMLVIWVSQLSFQIPNDLFLFKSFCWKECNIKTQTKNLIFFSIKDNIISNWLNSKLDIYKKKFIYKLRKYLFAKTRVKGPNNSHRWVNKSRIARFRSNCWEVHNYVNIIMNISKTFWSS